MSTLDLVTAILNKDATEIETTFNAAMAEKIATRLDDMHTEISQSMFKQPEEVSTEELSDTEQE